MNGYRIPHFGLDRQYASLKDELLEATHDSLSSGQLVDGPHTDWFEKWLTLRTGCRYAVTVHSGTQALEIIARHESYRFYDMYRLKPSIVIPNISYPATLNAFLREGFDVTICDTDKNGLLDLEKCFLKKDIIAVPCFVGLFGAPLKYAKYFENTNPRDEFIVDGAQHWLVSQEFETGIGMAISFDPTKNLPSSGNGGAIVTNDINLFEFALDFRNNGKGSHDRVGTNSKMSEQDCAQILVRTKHIDKWQARRKQIRNFYLDEFKDLPIRCLSDNMPRHADQKFVISTPHRDELDECMAQYGIECRVHYSYTLSDLVIARNLIRPDFLSVSKMLVRSLISLPMYPELTDAEIETIADTVKKFFSTIKDSVL